MLFILFSGHFGGETTPEAAALLPNRSWYPSTGKEIDGYCWKEGAVIEEFGRVDKLA